MINEQQARREVLEGNPAALRQIEALDWNAIAGEVPSNKRSSLETHPLPTHSAITGHCNWPEALRDAAYHGPSGQFVRAIEPHSETDPAALLLQFLTGTGNLVGREPHFTAERDYHACNLFAVLVGRTGKGRKGTSWGHAKTILGAVDDEWARNRVASGLASGEGLIWAVRDSMHERAPVREHGHVVRYEEVESDPGVSDKRLLVMEPEFARVLEVINREANTLSAVIRQAWETGDLGNLTKKQAARATGAHIGIVAHITMEELRRLLTDTAIANGFAGRFLWVCVQRSKELPFGGNLAAVDFAPLIKRLREVRDFARSVHELRRDREADAIWGRVYSALTAERMGMFGSVTSRAEPQVMRLACIYALLDVSQTIRKEHLLAALEVWRYCEDSARFIFGNALGDSTADEILRELRCRHDGLSRNDIREHFKRNKSSAEIDRALNVLQRNGMARMSGEQQKGPGRPVERWLAVGVTP